MKRVGMAWSIVVLSLTCSIATMASDGGWLRKVPQSERSRANPYSGESDAIAAGRVLFTENCAQCHGVDALGRHGRPSLRSERIRNASDGELAWLLRNGSLWKGMPSWTTLPEPERWQIIAYIRSLPRNDPSATAAAHP